ncbi:hypothetical protein KFE94_16560 [bacterium SCSIO 12643]|nr:hypothetical protein KFE94_16560 [bacterium SCSIO 12643]
MKKSYIVIFLLILGYTAQAQQGWNQKYSRKNQIYGYWGYNVSAYSKSDISFVGQNYNFTIYDVKANDRPTPFDFDLYFNPANLSIPQWNLRFGYFFADRWSISIGTDHMKYVMQQNQYVAMEGYINIPNGEYNGAYNRQPQELTSEFLMFEHTDGLNYGSIELEYHGNIYQFNDKHSINYYAGPGFGLLVPRSNVTLMGYDRYDEFHVAGYGLSGKVGLQAVLWKHLTFNAEWKNGFISMQDILTTGDNPTDRAMQTFWFTEFTGTIGFVINAKRNQ